MKVVLLDTPTVDVLPGEAVEVEVPAKGATGHVWSVKTDPESVRVVNHSRAPSVETFGGGGTEVFTLQPLREGCSKIVFQLAAPWRKTPAEEHEFAINCAERK